MVDISKNVEVLVRVMSGPSRQARRLLEVKVEFNDDLRVLKPCWDVMRAEFPARIGSGWQFFEVRCDISSTERARLLAFKDLIA